MDRKEFGIKNTIGDLYFCVDIETTGLKAAKGSILEVYWRIVSYNGEKEEVLESNHGMFFSPGWYKTRKIHQIPLKDLLFKPGFMSRKSRPFREELLKNIRRCIDPKDSLIFMAQYAPFEISWFENKLGIDTKGMRIYDTRQAEKDLYPDIPHNLIAMCKRRGIEPPEGQQAFHRASQDVDAMWQVAKQQFKELQEA